MQQVSLTAQWTAAIRAMETETEDGRLFEDKLARYLAIPDGFELLDRYSGGGVVEFVTIRTKYFDTEIEKVLSDHPEIKQIVFVAAGMDTRAFRLEWPEGVVIYEIDHGALLEEKRSRLAKAENFSCRVKRVEVAADLAENWKNELINAGFNVGQPTLWITEGLVFFLTEQQVRLLLTSLRSLSAGGSHLIVDMINRSLLKSPASMIFLDVLRQDGVPWQFGTDEPEQFLKELGWNALTVSEPGEVKVNREIWPYSVFPREQKGVSRSWLINACVDEQSV